MGDIVSLELLFDPHTDAAVRGEWAAIAAAGLTSQAHHRGATNRPHLTLLVRSFIGELDAVGLDDRLPMPLALGAPVLFGRGRTRVIARSVVPSSALLSLHAHLHARVGAGDDADPTRPGAWTPHVTLARRIPLDRVGDALSALTVDGGGTYLFGHAVAVRRWDARTKTVSVLAERGTLESC